MTASSASEFSAQGCHVWRGGLREDEVSAVGESIMKYFSHDLIDSALITDLRRHSHGLERVFDLQTALPEISGLLVNSRLLCMAASLLKVEAVRVFYTQAIVKYPAQRPTDHTYGVVGWHKDFAYWLGARAPRMITAWIPFVDTSADLGGLHYVDGSHRDRGTVTKGFNNPDLGTLNEVERVISPELSIGDVAFHHCLTTHASTPNKGAGPRLALAVHLLDVSLAPVNLALCHQSLKFLEGSDPTLVH